MSYLRNEYIRVETSEHPDSKKSSISRGALNLIYLIY